MRRVARRRSVGVCETCVDYAEEGAALYRVGESLRHVGNGRIRCPGQEDDDTDDRAELLSFTEFAKTWDSEFVAEVLADILTGAIE